MSEANHTAQVEYRQIERFPGYRFGSDGTVWSCWARKVGRWHPITMTEEWHELKGAIGADGRVVVTLKTPPDGKRRTFKVHRLILEAFRGPCPEGMEACHDPDRDPTNNRLDNLRWDTAKANTGDSIRHGTFPRGERSGVSRFTTSQVLSIRQRYDAGEPCSEIAKDYACSASTIRKFGNRTSWAWLLGPGA